MSTARRVRSAPQHGWPFAVVEWSDVAWRAPAYATTLDSLKRAGVRDVWADMTRVVIISGAEETTYGNDLDAMKTLAAARGIIVHGLAAEATWDSASTAQPLEVAAFAAAHGLPDIWYDVEPHTLPDWETNKATRITNYLGLVDTVSDTATIPTGWFLPFWWDGTEAAVPDVTYNSVTQTPWAHQVDILTGKSARIAIMAYRDTTGGGNGALDLIGAEFADRADVALWMAQEVAVDSPATVTYDGDPVHTFGNNMATIRASLSTRPGFAGIVIENAGALVPYLGA